MKRILILAFMLAAASSPLWAQGQPDSLKPAQTQPTFLDELLPLVDRKVSYTAVIDMPGTKKEDLQSRFRKWVATTYPNAKDLIQLDDKENGEMVCQVSYEKGWVFMMEVSTITIRYAIKMSFKDGKYRYAFTDYQLGEYLHGRQYEWPIERYAGNSKGNRRRLFKTEIDEPTQAKIKSMIAALSQPVKSDW